MNDLYVTNAEMEAVAAGINFGSMLLTVAPGGETEGHEHRSAEVWVVESGTGYVIVGERRIEMVVATPVEIPAGHFHTVFNDGQDDLVFLALWWKRAA